MPLAVAATGLPLGGGSAVVCTLLEGARCCGIEPVASFCADCVAKGLPKREDSELQATVPTAIAAKTKARDNEFERNDPTKKDMAFPPVRKRNNTGGRVNTWGVNKALS
jgi:hypothetical protein